MSWNKVRLGDCATFSNGVNFGKDAYSKGVKLISVSNFENRLVPNYDELVEIKQDILRENDYLKNGDIVFVRSNGNKELVGRCMIIENNDTPLTYSGFCIRARMNDITKNNPKFMVYHFKTPIFKKSISSSSTGTNIQNLNQGLLANYCMNIPEYQIQCRIASILSAYDDLIENNQKQIKLLEEAAQRLYTEWFVDLHFPGYEDTKIVDGVPEGWKIKELNDYCYVTDGTHESPKSKSSGIPLVTGKCIKNGQINFSEANLISEEEHEKIKVRSGLATGDILFSNIGTVGSTCRVNYDREFSVKNVIILKPTSNSQSIYLYYWLSSRNIQDSFLTQTNGSSQQFIGLNFMRKFKLVIPTETIEFKFEERINPIVNKKDVLHLQNIQLAEARDRLLPKLMSGELEV